ncbi:hypothetical protein C0J52_22001 [Blattella germanica]|nr:hypothetical protein C0J52_22001 [Blattella germanica]
MNHCREEICTEGRQGGVHPSDTPCTNGWLMFTSNMLAGVTLSGLRRNEIGIDKQCFSAGKRGWFHQLPGVSNSFLLRLNEVTPAKLLLVNIGQLMVHREPNGWIPPILPLVKVSFLW